MRNRWPAAVFAIATTFAAVGAQAQYAATLDVASRDRYRGTDIGDAGAVVRASLMADAPRRLLDGAYAGISGAWRARDAALQTAEALIGWSRRFDTLAGLASVDPRWGWDSGIHYLHYGSESGSDFHEFMLGLLAPAGSARLWWSPHYFGGPLSSLYAELNSSVDLTDRWRLFGHVGWLGYGRQSTLRIPDRADALIGTAYAAGRWDIRLMRDGSRSIGSLADSTARRSSVAWVISVGVAF